MSAILAPKIRALPSEYKGVQMRSRLETRVAAKLDALGIVWNYEAEGYDLGVGVWYLPDFWLPEIHTFVEVKGLIDARGALRKPHHFSAALSGDPWEFELTRPAVAILSEMWVRDESDGFTVLAGGRCVDEPLFCRCVVCGGWWFLSGDGHFACRACGADSGNNFDEIVHGGRCDTCRSGS